MSPPARWRAGPRAAAVLALSVAAVLACRGAGAASLRLCDRPSGWSAGQQDRLLGWAAVALGRLEGSGATVALVARSGLDLDRFAIRYSHAGLALRAHPQGRWTVRQLYYACDERRPRLYDQGLPGFVFGTDDPERGHLSAVLLPPEAATAVAAAALDGRTALSLLGTTYSANAWPWSLRYQNCNQWVAELLARAWGGRGDATGLAEGGHEAPRAAAQRWLRAVGYEPAEVDIGTRWVSFAAGFVPWVRLDDHPDAERYGLRQQLSLPSALERFVRAQWPQAQRLEFCHAGARVVVRRGWVPLDAACAGGPDDEVVVLEDAVVSRPAP